MHSNFRNMRILIEKLHGKKPLQDLREDGIVPLKWIMNTVLECDLESSGSVDGSCESGNEIWDSIKGGEILHQLLK
jgi:hypothetical protein